MKLTFCSNALIQYAYYDYFSNLLSALRPHIDIPEAYRSSPTCIACRWRGGGLFCNTRHFQILQLTSASSQRLGTANDCSKSEPHTIFTPMLPRAAFVSLFSSSDAAIKAASVRIKWKSHSSRESESDGGRKESEGENRKKHKNRRT